MRHGFMEHMHSKPCSYLEPWRITMNARLRWSGPALLILLAAIGSLWGLNQAGAIRMSGRSLETMDHGRFDLDSIRGRTRVICFFSTTCLPSKRELADLQEIGQRRFHQEPPVVLAVCVDPHNYQAARSWVDELGLNMPVLLDFDGVLANEMGVRMVPETFVQDATGKNLLHLSGWSDSAADMVSGALGGR
jgi:peroxiredoxin